MVFFLDGQNHFVFCVGANAGGLVGSGVVGEEGGERIGFVKVGG